MLDWIINNWGAILVCAIIAGIVALLIYSMIRDKKKGKSSCGGSCAGCSMGCHSGACNMSQTKKESESANSDDIKTDSGQ